MHLRNLKFKEIEGTLYKIRDFWTIELARWWNFPLEGEEEALTRKGPELLRNDGSLELSHVGLQVYSEE